LAGICRCRRFTQLWHHARLGLRPDRSLCQSHPQRGQARRPAGSAADDVRDGGQSQSRTRTWDDHITLRACPRPPGGRMIGRRSLITLLGGGAASAVSWPLTAHAQQLGKMPTIGFLGAITPTGFAKQLAGFRLGLSDRGFIEGVNITVEYRWAEGHYER